MSERLSLLGLLEEKKQQAAKLRLKIEGMRDSVRMNLPRHDPIESLNGELVAIEAVEMAASIVAYKDLLDEISAIKRDVGA